MSTVAVRVTILSFSCITLVGCSGTKDPKELLVGRWSADMSAAAVGARAAQLKSENPDASSSTVMSGARTLGMMTLDLRADGTVTVTQQGGTQEGTWKFDAARSEVEFDLGPTNAGGVAAPADAAQKAPAKRTTWIATLDPKNETLELFLGDRAGYDFFKQVSGGKKGGLFVLRKQ
jgi:hypothetical protein